MTRKTKRVEFKFDERSQVTREEAEDEYLCARCGNPLVSCKCGGEGVIHCAAGNALVGFGEEQMKILQSYRLGETQLKAKIRQLRDEVTTLKVALSKSDPIHRIYDEGIPVLVCIHCGGRRGRFENEVHHEPDCIWLTSQKKVGEK